MNKKVIRIGLLVALVALGFLLFRANQSSNVSPRQMSSDSAGSLRVKGSPLSQPLKVSPGFTVRTFATDIPQARDLLFTENETLLVSSPETGSVYALPDKDGDGLADENKVVLSGLNTPHGLAMYKGKLFVSEVDQVVRYDWDETSLSATKEKVLFQLPANANHNKRTLLFDNAGNLYISVGSTCNVCEENDERSGTILISDSEGKKPEIYSKGLRNAPFMTIQPETGEIWATEMGRDNLGDNMPPDELNIIKRGSNYGWPYCYDDRVYDSQFGKKSLSYCASTALPLYKIPAHSAPLGLNFVTGNLFPEEWHGDLLVAYHGSWNRSSKTGYKVVRLTIEGQKVTAAEDFITGFLVVDDAWGRPVDIEFDKDGYSYISDDKADQIYVISPQ